MSDEPAPLDEYLNKKPAPARKSLDEFGQNVVDSLSKMGQEVSDYLKKTAEKRYRDIFKDIEINRREFFILALIGQSLSAIIILNIVGFVNIFEAGFDQTLGVSGIALGFVVGLALSSRLLRKLERRYPFLAISLIFSALIHFAYPILGSYDYLAGLQIAIMGINGFIFGMVALIYTTLFIEFTSITERGRVITFNFIFIFLSALIITLLAIMGILTSLLVAAIPILTAAFLWKIQKSEKVDQKRFELPVKVPLRDRIRNNRYLVFYAVIFFAFSFSIGLFFPLGDIESILSHTFPSNRFILILLGSLILAAIVLFIIGYAYDFAGRRFVIGVAAMILGILNYGQLFFHALEPIVIPITFIMVLIMAIPLIVGDFSLTYEIPRGNASFLLITLSGVILGIYLQSYFTLENFKIEGSKEVTVMVLAIIVLFILMNMKEIISSKEQSWPEMLYHLYVVHESGMLLYEHSFKAIEKKVESDLVSGGIIGLTTLLEEIVRGNQRLRTIDHGDKKLLFRYSADQKIVYVLLIKEDLLVIRNKMRTFAEDFECKFADQIAKFNGVRLDTWKSTSEIVQKNFERKYFLT